MSQEKEKYNNLLIVIKELKSLKLVEVVNYYLEAATGNVTTEGTLPKKTLKLIDSLNEALEDAIQDAWLWPQSTNEGCPLCERSDRESISDPENYCYQCSPKVKTETPEPCPTCQRTQTDIINNPAYSCYCLE